MSKPIPLLKPNDFATCSIHGIAAVAGTRDRDWIKIPKKVNPAIKRPDI